jgi:hypothetical protein
MDFGTQVGFGKYLINMVQPLPEIPNDYIKEVRIKRVFFYIEPQGDRNRKVNMWQRYIGGRDNINFRFLNKLVIEAGHKQLEKKMGATPDFTPLVSDAEEVKGKTSLLHTVFEEMAGEAINPELNPEKIDNFILVKYSKDNRTSSLNNFSNGQMHIIKTKSPAQLKRFLLEHPHLKDHFKRIHILKSSILVELVKDPIIEEGFKTVYAESSEELEKFEAIPELCDIRTCLDFTLPDVNLIPLLMKGNALNVNAYIDADRVPDSFQLKGFLEFEVKLNLSF